MIVLLMFVFPVVFVLAELFILKSNTEVTQLIGKWFVFGAVGVGLFLAGLRQTINPQSTANQIFGIKSSEPLVIVRELGFANLSIGILGLSTVVHNSWVMPAAILGGLFYGFAGIRHCTSNDRNRLENIAMVSDLFVFVVLLVYFINAIAHE